MVPDETIDLEHRRPVWQVLSNLFLDIEWLDEELCDFSGILVDSPFTLEQLEEILYKEVYPACSWNLSMWGAYAPGDFEFTWSMIEPKVLGNKKPWLKWRIFQTKRYIVRATWIRLAEIIRQKRLEQSGVAEYDGQDNNRSNEQEVNEK